MRGSPDQTPIEIPNYRLIRRIGGGAYGSVWLAENTVTKHLQAVKVVFKDHPAFTDDRHFKRALEGIQRYEPISRNHPHVLQILYVGSEKDLRYLYYVMELADDVNSGTEIALQSYHPRSLKDDLARDEGPAFEDLLNICACLTDALAYLHSLNLVHRDVKPANVVYVNGTLKLADNDLVTEPGSEKSIVGTPGYTAPEVLEQRQVDARSDIYSLGVLLHQLATRLPLNDFPKLPPDLPDRTDRIEILELNEIWDRACRREPADRYPDVAAMRSDVEKLQAGISLWRPKVLRQKIRRGALVCLAVLVLAAGGWFLIDWLQPKLRLARTLQSADIADWRGLYLGNYDTQPETEFFVLQKRELFVFSSQGLRLDRLPFPELPGESGMGRLIDVEKDGYSEVILNWREGTNAGTSIHNLNMFERQRFEAWANTNSLPQHGPSATALSGIDVVDLATDGNPEFLAGVQTGYGRYPRGLYCYDYNTGALRWTHLTGSFVQSVRVLDLDGDSDLEILFGSGSANNGNRLADGTDDAHTYLYVLDHEGRLLWRHEMAGVHSKTWPVPADLDGDGRLEIVAALSAHSVPRRNEPEPEIGRVVLFDAAGAIRATRNLEGELWRAIAGDYDNDGRDEIFATDVKGYLHVFGENLTPVAKKKLVPATHWIVELHLDGVGDLDSDGRNEIVLHCSQREFVKGSTLGHAQDDSAVRNFHDNSLLLLNDQLDIVAQRLIAKERRNLPDFEVRVGDFDNRGYPQMLVISQAEAQIWEFRSPLR